MDLDFEQENVVSLDACIKCSACTAHCPVSAVQPLFSGPKSLGPDTERFRLQGLEIDSANLNYCSNCKTCEVTCPSGVRITEMILRAREKDRSKERTKTFQHQVRDLLLGHADYLGRVGTIWPNLTNNLLGVPLIRGLMERTLGISRQAPLPEYGHTFHGKHNRRTKQQTLQTKQRTPHKNAITKRVVYFPGCFVTYNEALTGQAVVKVLEHNGYEVILPRFKCCGVPLQANGHFQAARENARTNLELMIPYLREGLPLITSCTSCGLGLKEDYPRTDVYDLFEFLWELHERDELSQVFQEVKQSLGYHPPCHLKAQGIGTPSVRILRLIPGVKVTEIDEGCCGLSGSYGFKQEHYESALRIGRSLFERVRQGVDKGEFETLTTECGGCKMQIEHGTGVETKHPIWILMEAYGIS